MSPKSKPGGFRIQNRLPVSLALAGLGGVLIAWGLLRGEGAIVLKKAITVCLECIGIG